MTEDPEAGIVGFACLGPPSDADLPGATELKAIYLDPGLYGSGLGTRFWRELEAQTDAARVYLWALAANQRGRAFYAKNGFRPDGETKTFEIEGQTFHEIRLQKRLR